MFGAAPLDKKRSSRLNAKAQQSRAVAMSNDENDWYVEVQSDQLLLQLQAAQSRHSHIKDDAGGAFRTRALEKIAG
jgi:hypothetical protein